MAVCTSRALSVDLPSEPPISRDAPPEAQSVLVVPAALFEQFGEGFGPQQVLEALRALGFERIRLDLEWEEALRKAVLAYAREEAEAMPVISPVCPAVLNLIRSRYPALMTQVAPFLTPIEAACEALTEPFAVFVGICPAQRTVLRAARPLTRTQVAAAAALEAAIRAHAGAETGPRHEMRGVYTTEHGRDVLVSSGMPHVAWVLDKLENGLLREYAAIELYACPQGCFGSPVWKVNPFVTRQRFDGARAWYEGLLRTPHGGKGARAIRRLERLRARGGMRLDEDMAKAIEKLARIDAIAKQLPGHDCGCCGAPNCAAFAEDVALGRVAAEACVFSGGAFSRGKRHEPE